MTKRCETCGKALAVAPCPHCLHVRRLRHARLVELRDEIRAVQSRLSSRLSGLSEPQDVIDNLWAAMKILGDVSRSLREATKPEVQ